jgi:pSer/pThr/pTyr-binding forkhead associated (FHA) protein/uncharacterized protein involved in exopolysaccharide biosynthesis
MSNSRDPSGEPDREVSSEIDVPTVGGEVVAHACLAVIDGREAGRLFALINREELIGRASNAQIQIDDGAISTQHAKLFWDGSRHTIIDMGSTNGTFVNGERLTQYEPVALNFGDTLKIADIQLAYLERQERDDPHGRTQALALHGPHTSRLDPVRYPEEQLIAQLLHSGFPTEVQQKPPTLEERMETLMRALNFLKRSWLPIFCGAALFGLLATASVLVSPPTTQAQFKLRISMKPTENPGERPNRDEITQFYSAAEQNFTNPKLIEKTLTDVKGTRPARGEVNGAIKATSFESIALATYEGLFTSSDPEFAYRFLNTHLKNYLASEVERTIRGIQAEVDFVSGRLKESEQELQKTESELKDFKLKHLQALPGFEREQMSSRSALLLRRSDLSAQLTKTNLELELAKKRLTEAAPLLSKRVENAQPYEASLTEVRRKLGEARAKGYGPEHPEVQTLTKQQAELQRMADEARRTEASVLDREANPGLVELKNRVGDLAVAAKGIGAELGEVNAQVQRLDNIVGAAPEVEARYAQLTRSYDSTREIHGKLFERLRTSQLRLELERTSANARYEVIAPPESSGVPLRRALLLRAAIGIVIGLGAGLALALVLEVRRRLRRRIAQKRSPVTSVAELSRRLGR